ncbi:hypothetical protein [Paenibacillus glacialis]|uniref:AAA domain-containing protein n=1 Tax=Paenibacillus glacialis TaxID=494026 RepID=A0A168HQZ7_9BACL|nr:hypothetical protein [Paenibacillus glacialis]OAB38440.1 hypothetical protein PGLA_20320 [Paenibacillus glacialis]
MGQVSFWGMQHGLGVTSSTAAIAALIGMEYQIRTLISQPQWSDRTLERSFHKAINQYNRHSEHDSGSGLDALERVIKSNKMERDTVKNYTLMLERERLDLLRGTDKKEKFQFENSNEVIEVIYQRASQYYDAILLDVHSGNNSVIIDNTLGKSDLIVVCVNQNITLLEKYFDENKESWNMALNEVPHVLLINQYDPNSKYKVRNIMKKYNYKGKIITIPYNTEFKDHINDGDVKGYFSKNRNVTKHHDNYYFIKEVRRAAEMILTEIGVNTHIKSIERGAI